MEDGEPGFFALVTGTAPHFLLDEPPIQKCPNHEWKFCNACGTAACERPIMERSTVPRSFFTDAGRFHCANSRTRDVKSNPRASDSRAFCLIFAFEEFSPRRVLRRLREPLRQAAAVGASRCPGKAISATAAQVYACRCFEEEVSADRIVSRERQPGRARATSRPVQSVPR
jgi:hypothetical protein